MYSIYRPILASLSLTASFQNSLKTRIKLHKIACRMSKIVEGGGGKGGRRRENGGIAPWLLGGGDKRPWGRVHFCRVAGTVTLHV